jgi:hypothetical protein
VAVSEKFVTIAESKQTWKPLNSFRDRGEFYCARSHRPSLRRLFKGGGAQSAILGSIYPVPADPEPVHRAVTGDENGLQRHGTSLATGTSSPHSPWPCSSSRQSRACAIHQPGIGIYYCTHSSSHGHGGRLPGRRFVYANQL